MADAFDDIKTIIIVQLILGLICPIILLFMLFYSVALYNQSHTILLSL